MERMELRELKWELLESTVLAMAFGLFLGTSATTMNLWHLAMALAFAVLWIVSPRAIYKKFTARGTDQQAVAVSEKERIRMEKDERVGLGFLAMIAGISLGVYVNIGESIYLALALGFLVATIAGWRGLYEEYNEVYSWWVLREALRGEYKSLDSQSDQPPKTGGGSN